MSGNRSITDFVEGPERRMAEECARTFAILASKLARSIDEPGSISRTQGAIFARQEAERLFRRFQFDDPLPPWPDDAPARDTWEDFALGRRRE
jgi:hypothetical protein